MIEIERPWVLVLLVSLVVLWFIIGIVALRLATLYDKTVQDKLVISKADANVLICMGPFAFMLVSYNWISYIFEHLGVGRMLRRLGGFDTRGE